MSEQTEAKPEAKQATAVAEKPAEPVEKPFTVDVLTNCTSRFTRKAQDLFLAYQKDMEKIRKTPIRATLEAHTLDGAETLHRLLLEDGVQEISRKDKVVSMTTTFEVIQKVIKLPESAMLDAVKL